MKADDLCVVTNRSSGMVIMSIPEMRVRKVFYPGETKEVEFKELKAFVN